MSAEAAVRYTQVDKRYDQQVVLDRLSLTVPHGRTTVLIGASGCGKSTLIQLANGLVPPDAGTVEVFGTAVGAGVDATTLQRLRLRIGYAVQSIGLFPHLTLRANITLLARLLQREDEWIAARLAWLCDGFDLALEMLDRYPLEVSGGQQQRAGLARAMFLEPELLLLDEPFSAVDPITRGNIHEQFLTLKRETHTSVLLVTHDMREALLLGDELVFMRDGGIVRAGTPDEIRANPGPDYVAHLLEAQLG